MSAAAAVFYAVRAIDTVRPIRSKAFPAPRRNASVRIYRSNATPPRRLIDDEEGPIDAHRHLDQGLQQHHDPWPQTSAEHGCGADGLGLDKICHRDVPTLLFAGCSADQAGGARCCRFGQADGKGTPGLCHPAVIRKNAVDCMLMTLDFGRVQTRCYGRVSNRFVKGLLFTILPFGADGCGIYEAPRNILRYSRSRGPGDET